MKRKTEDATERPTKLEPPFWGKTSERQANENPSARRYHPLLFHMLDVAAVAGLVWDHWLAPSIRKRIECALGSAAKSQVVFLAGTHDLGKASPGFQRCPHACGGEPQGFVVGRFL